MKCSYWKPVKKKALVIAAILIVVICAASGCADSSKKIDWSTIVLKDVIPEPPSTQGEINVNSDEELSVNLEKVTDDQYNTYLNECIDMGFDIDAEKSSGSYEAYNLDGYSLRLSRSDDELDITVEVSMQTSTPEPTATEAPVTASPTEEAESVTPTATPEPTTNDTGNADSNGIRSDFKAAMDSYESFINDYVDFYKKYEENPSDLSLLADYADYMTKLSDMTSKFDQWESEGLNDAELDYWLEVQTRVNAKLVEVAQ